jgi:hypothetical protein
MAYLRQEKPIKASEVNWNEIWKIPTKDLIYYSKLRLNAGLRILIAQEIDRRNWNGPT